MGIFGAKKVKFFRMGMLMGIECPCKGSGSGMDYLAILDDEAVSGFSNDDLLKCGSCGRIFIGPNQPDQGKIVGQGRTYIEEGAEGIRRS